MEIKGVAVDGKKFHEDITDNFSPKDICKKFDLVEFSIRNNGVEVYFKLNDFDGLILNKHGNSVHEIITPSWKDGYDPVYSDNFKYPYLTVTTHNKWYYVYLVNEDGSVEYIHTPIPEDDIVIGWYDHAISPHYFYNLGKHFNATIIHDAFISVVDMWLDEYLDGEITKLHYYLPK